MKRLFLLLVFVCAVSFGQETDFTFSKDGFTDFVVNECPGKTQNELYKKSIDWLAVTYNNPKEVLKAQIENDYIRIEGFSKNLLCFGGMGKTYYDANYQIEISFKEGKYKFDVISVTLLNTKSDPKIELEDMNEYYKSNGSIKGIYKYFPEVFPAFFNDLNKNLSEFINNNTASSKKGDW
jgi:hypothetical protein